MIRFNREPIDASKPQEVQLGLNRPIVYQNSLDITQHIIDSLNPTARGAGSADACGCRPAAAGHSARHATLSRSAARVRGCSPQPLFR